MGLFSCHKLSTFIFDSGAYRAYIYYILIKYKSMGKVRILSKLEVFGFIALGASALIAVGITWAAYLVHINGIYF